MKMNLSRKLLRGSIKTFRTQAKAAQLKRPKLAPGKRAVFETLWV